MSSPDASPTLRVHLNRGIPIRSNGRIAAAGVLVVAAILCTERAGNAITSTIAIGCYAAAVLLLLVTRTHEAKQSLQLGPASRVAIAGVAMTLWILGAWRLISS